MVNRSVNCDVGLDLLEKINQYGAEISEIKTRVRGRGGDLVEALPDWCERRRAQALRLRPC